MSDYWKKRLDELNRSNTAKSEKEKPADTNYWQAKLDELNKKEKEKKKREEDKQDIAPVQTTQQNTLLQKGALDNGVSVPSISKSILGTLADAAVDFGAGILGMGEKAVDSAAQLGAWSYGGLTQQQGVYPVPVYSFNLKEREKAMDDAAEFIAKDLYDEEKIAKKIVGNVTSAAYLSNINMGGGYATVKDLERAQGMRVASADYLDNQMEADSVLGAKADSLVQSAGQLVATSALQATGIPWFLTTGVTAYGSELENAYREGATFEEAGTSAAISAGAEILTEKIGGIKFGGKSLSDALIQPFVRRVSNKAVRMLANAGIDALGEGGEEILSGLLSAVGQKMTYMDDKELNELFTSEDAFDSFMGGLILGGSSNVIGAVKSEAQGKDAVTGLTKNEQKVVDKVYKDEIAKEEQGGKKLGALEKNKLYDKVIDDMEKGRISTDTIEEVLGGDEYSAIGTLQSEADEFNTLYDTEGSKLSEKQKDRLAELKQKNTATPYETALKDARSKLSQSVLERVQNDRLVESYNDRERKKQDFEPDYDRFKGSKNEEAARKTLDNAVRLGANNSRAVHDLVDMAAQFSADTGLTFDFQSAEQIKAEFLDMQGKRIAELEKIPEAQRTAEQSKKLAALQQLVADVESGKTKVNGNITENGIVLNLDSDKPLNRIIGHEVTHSLENAKNYEKLRDALFRYAKSKKIDIDKVLAERKLMYEGVKDADPEKELVADMVGDFLFSDMDYITDLSVNHRDIFQRIWDEIKYLAKVATAGSKEARELERVKKAFENAYRESGKQSTEAAETQYSLVDSDGKQLTEEDNDVKVMDGGSVTKFSLSTWTPETQSRVRDNLVKAGYDDARVDKWITDTNSVAAVIAADKDRLDFVAADNQVMLKNNQEYVKTLDASTLCAKRLVYQGTFDAIQHRMPNTMLSSDDLIDLLNMMKAHGVQTPCGVCYVESRRRHLGKFAQEWLNSYKGEYKPSLDEVTTSDGLEALRHSHPDTYKDFVDAMNKKGSSNPKVVQLRTEYRNEIMSLTPAQIKKIEAIGGLRVQSFSDFETPHLLDMMQAVMDMSAQGLTSQAYTKVPNFAWVFGDTGIKINLSLIAEGDGFDADGNLAFSSVEGMDIDEAMKLRDAYSENVGTIIVGANDKHILACMADDRIDFIIPFHRSGWGKNELDMMGMSSYTDYTYGQKEHDLATGKGLENLYPPDYWDYNLSGKENAERYLNLCARTGREPKFSQFLVNNGDGSYSLQPDGSTDGYWKTLIDFKMYNNEGVGAAQQKVQPNFNMDEAYRVLNEYEGGANKLPVANDVVEEFVAKYNSRDQLAPTMSLSREGEQFAPTRRNEVYGRDIRLEQEVAPITVAENATVDEAAPMVEVRPTTAQIEDIAPVAMRDSNPTLTEKYEPPKAKQPKTTPQEQVRAQILTEEPETAKRKSGLWSVIKDNFIDKGTVFEKLDLQRGSRELQARFKAIGRAESKAQYFMEHGDAATSSLKSIRDTVESSGKTKDFYEYLYHQLNVDRMSLEERFEDVENKPVIGYDVTADMSRNTAAELEAANPEFKKWAEQVYDYMSELRKMLVDNGVISADTAKLWAEMYPHYVPIRRKGDDGVNINVALDTRRTGINAPVKRATGGNRDILPLFDTMAMRTEQTFKAVARNRFGVELKNALGAEAKGEAVGVDEAIDSVETHEELLQEGKNGRNPTFTVFENGEKVTFDINDEMYDTMKPKDRAYAKINNSRISKGLQAANNIRRNLITEYNPAFMITNPIKDTQDVLINSQHPAKTYANYPKAIAELWNKNGQYYQEYMSNGGDQNTYFDSTKKTFTKEKSRIGKVIGFPLEKISAANSFIERVPRMAEYIASRKEGRSIDVAMLDAARVTTDFSAGGDLVKLANRNGFTFLNASVQGFAQQVRNFREAKAEGFKGLVHLAAKVAVAGLPSILLNHLLWDDDEDYAELSDYVKQNYYIVAKYGDGKFVRIPKGRMLAVIQDAFEQMENLVTGNDEVDLKAFKDLVFSNLAPNNPLENNIIAPITQAAKNKAWYGDDLVPTRLQNLPPAEQYDESTDSVSRWLGDTLNISPYKINYVLDQYSGAIGDMFLPMLTPEAERGNNTLIAPVIDKFTADSVMNNQNVSDFYDTKEELTVNANAYDATDEDKLMSKYMNSVNSELNKLYKQKREVQNSSLSDAEKYEAAREIQKQIIQLTKESLNTYEDIRYMGNIAVIGDKYYKKNNDDEWQKLTGEQLERQEEVTKGLGVSEEEYWSNREEYSYAYDNPESYAVAKAVGGYEAYKTYTSELYDIKADKDANGKSISGSRKEKVIDYINGLDADHYTKIILFKNEYPSDDTYNYEIIDYLNSRDDISRSEMETILKKLGFEVDAKGNISW